MGGIGGVGRSCEITCGFKSYCCHCETQVLLALRRDPPVATNNGRQRSIAMHREGEIVYNWLKRGKIYNRVASEGSESIQLLASESEGLSWGSAQYISRQWGLG